MTNKKKVMIGVIALVAFFVVLAIFFSPVFGGKNGLQKLDNLYNSISKGSTYYIPDTRTKAEQFNGTALSLTLKTASAEQADQTALLFTKSGATAQVSETKVNVAGDLGKILGNCLDDSDSMYFNDGAKVAAKYGYDERQVMFNWWNALKSMNKELSAKKQFKEAKIVTVVQERAVEPAYNYYKIQPEKISGRLGVVIFSLAFYVVYTLWYGFAILFLFEGAGLKLEH
jgi:hypothetical protein